MYGRAFVKGSLFKDRELLERAFGNYMSRIARTTREMGKAGRIDVITECTARYNKIVVDKLLITLQKDVDSYPARLAKNLDTLATIWSKCQRHVDGMPSYSLFVEGGVTRVDDLNGEATKFLNWVLKTLKQTAKIASSRRKPVMEHKKELEYMHLYGVYERLYQQLPPNFAQFGPEETICVSPEIGEFLEQAREVHGTLEKLNTKRAKLYTELKGKHAPSLQKLPGYDEETFTEKDFVAYIKQGSIGNNLQWVQNNIEGHAHTTKCALASSKATGTSSKDQVRYKHIYQANLKRLQTSIKQYNNLSKLQEGYQQEDDITSERVLSGQLDTLPWVRSFFVNHADRGIVVLKLITLAEAWGAVLRIQEQPAAFSKWLAN